MKDVQAILKSGGRSMLGAGRVLGKQVIALYRTIDPDVTRHLLQMPLLSYTLLASRAETIEPQEADGHHPLIFVHGLGGSRGDFLPMMGFFWIAGRRRSYRISFERGQTVEQMGDALATFIRKVLKTTGEKKVDLVAHSLGGLICRLALSQHGLSPNVGTLITLGSPHRGTHSARFANTEILRDLRPDSRLMKTLEAAPWPKGVRGVCFWSENDLLVLPANSATLSGMKAVNATPFTHYSYLLNPSSWVAVHTALQARRSVSSGIGRQ